MLKQNDFEGKFRGRGLTKLEMQELFRTMDLNDSGMVDEREQNYFQKLFINDFFVCADNGWKITADKAKQCLTKQSWFENLRLNEENRENMSQAPHENEEESTDFMTDLIHAADRNLDGTLNLAEYLFLRKTGSAWRQCVTGDAMNQLELQCGLRTTSIHASLINKGDARKVFLTAVSWMMLNTKRLSFTVFFRVAQYFRTFNSYCKPHVDCVINKRQLYNQIELQSSPTSLSPLEARYVGIYYNIQKVEVMDFPNFLAMSYWTDKFMLYATDDSMLSLSEFHRLLSDRSVSWKLRATIDYSEQGIDKSFLKIVEQQAQEMSVGQGRKKKSASAEKEITEDDYFQHIGSSPSSFLQTASRNPVQKGIKAKAADKNPMQREVIFNILDHDMTGKLDMYEFFELIKQYQVFHTCAGGADKQDPWRITRSSLKRYESDTSNLIPGFPTEHAKSVFRAMDMNFLSIYEMNFKEFLLLFEIDDTFRRYATVPHSIFGVPLVNLITNLLRFDLPVINEDRFVKFTLDTPPMTASQPALQNYQRAVYILILQEQLAIMRAKNEKAKKDIGFDFGSLEAAENKLLGRDDSRFTVQPASTTQTAPAPHYNKGIVAQESSTTAPAVAANSLSANNSSSASSETNESTADKSKDVSFAESSATSNQEQDKSNQNNDASTAQGSNDNSSAESGSDSNSAQEHNSVEIQ